MSSHKTVKFEDKKYKLAKKRQRIKNTVDAVYCILLFICIGIGGANQHNDTAVGWVCIAIGIISIPAAIFHIYAAVNKWEPVFWYSAPQNRHYQSAARREQDLSELRLISGIVIVCLVSFAIALPIIGITRLLR